MSHFFAPNQFHWGLVSMVSFWQTYSLKNIHLTAGFPTHGWHSSNIFHLFSIYYWDWDSIGKIIKKIAWLSHYFFVRSVCWEVRPTTGTREIGAVRLNYFKKSEKNTWLCDLFVVRSNMNYMIIILFMYFYLKIGKKYLTRIGIV